MPWLLLLALILSVLALIFAIQNTASVTVAFLFWKTQSPLTVVLLIALGIGSLVTAFALLPARIRDKWSSFSKGRHIGDIQVELTTCQEELEKAKSRIHKLTAERDEARDAHQASGRRPNVDRGSTSP